MEWERIADDLAIAIVADPELIKMTTADQREEIAKEIHKRRKLIDVTILVQPLVKLLQEKIESAQGRLDDPKEKLKENYTATYREIGTSESGTGSHARRKTRVATALEGGCKMEDNASDLISTFADAKEKSAALPQSVTEILWAQGKKYLARGSWSGKWLQSQRNEIDRPILFTFLQQMKFTANSLVSGMMLLLYVFS